MTTETDRELLELAAKAAGVELLDWRDSWSDYSGPAWRTVDRELWNPLNIETGDALRLAVKLGMSLRVVHGMAGWTDVEGITQPHAQDAEAATCRAIVRAAAEIGRAMP